jgi:hypothetical protein
MTCGCESKGIYRITKYILLAVAPPFLPIGGTPRKLAQQVRNFVTQNIDTIRNNLQNVANLVSQPVETPTEVSLEPLAPFVSSF